LSRKKNKRGRHIPMRRCVGCMESKPQQELVRIVFSDGRLIVDKDGKTNGRGVYLCRNPDCISQARKKNAFSRNYKQKIKEEITDPVFSEVLQMCEETDQK